jgi:hypothetical protein
MHEAGKDHVHEISTGLQFSGQHKMCLEKSDSATVDVSGSIDANLLVLIYLDNPAILNYQTYGAEADRLQCIAQQALQFPVPKIRAMAAHF